MSVGLYTRTRTDDGCSVSVPQGPEDPRCLHRVTVDRGSRTKDRGAQATIGRKVQGSLSFPLP